ncbi:MAG: phosphatidylserine decarboxylase, partial [Flavobacteriales bacterium]|nr:phosphatidylserine decarboxylase [Flavobacteriales bacterium]
MNKSNPKWPKTTKAYKELKKQIKEDKAFSLALETSLQIAVRRGNAELNPDLYHAIDNVFDGNGWPTSPDDYLDYVEKYLVLIPNETNDPAYPAAWTSDDTVNGYNQKVYDLLCHFYFLVDQTLPLTGATMQDYKHGKFIFADWLRDFAVD